MKPFIVFALSCALGSAVVAFRAATPQDRQSIAMVVVLDQSSSMSGAKIDLAKEGAKSLLAPLGSKDFFGVLTFAYNFRWALGIAEVGNKDAMRDAFSKIVATGNTNIYPALREAYERLKATNSGVRHIILLSDGQTPKEDFMALTAEMLQNNVTISTVALTAASDRQLMADIALLGGGRSYFVETPDSIPQIFNDEALFVVWKASQ